MIKITPPGKQQFPFCGLSLVCLLFQLSVHAQGPAGYRLENDGVVIHPDPRLSGNAKTLKLQVITGDIIRVIASQDQDLSTRNSLSVNYAAANNTKWETKESGNKVTLTTPSLTAVADIQTGAVSFSDKNGNKIVAEREITGRAIVPAVFEGESLYGVRQTFETTADDAFYGLGQHQEDIFNYKGQQVLFFQNNTEVAIPFLVSSKNYGILWDNYSLSKWGDVRNWPGGWMPANRIYFPMYHRKEENNKCPPPLSVQRLNT